MLFPPVFKFAHQIGRFTSRGKAGSLTQSLWFSPTFSCTRKIKYFPGICALNPRFQWSGQPFLAIIVIRLVWPFLVRSPPPVSTFECMSTPLLKFYNRSRAHPEQSLWPYRPRSPRGSVRREWSIWSALQIQAPLPKTTERPFIQPTAFQLQNSRNDSYDNCSMCTGFIPNP